MDGLEKHPSYILLHFIFSNFRVVVYFSRKYCTEIFRILARNCKNQFIWWMEHNQEVANSSAWIRLTRSVPESLILFLDFRSLPRLTFHPNGYFIISTKAYRIWKSNQNLSVVVLTHQARRTNRWSLFSQMVSVHHKKQNHSNLNKTHYKVKWGLVGHSEVSWLARFYYHN